MATTCPCGATIPIEDINVPEGVALCRRCGKLSRLADLAGVDQAPRDKGSKKDQAEERKALALAQGDPPGGCAIRDFGDRVTLRASARSVGGAAGMLFFAAFWNGITGIFVVIMISSLLLHLGVTLPAWFPTPFASGGGGSGNQNMPLGMTIFMALFLTPFVLIGLTVIGALFVTIAGRVEVRLRGPDGEIFTGVGPFGMKRRFNADSVEAVLLTDADIEENGKKKRAIAIETSKKTLKFASLLPDQRRLWLGGVLKTMLLPIPGG